MVTWSIVGTGTPGQQVVITPAPEVALPADMELEEPDMSGLRLEVEWLVREDRELLDSDDIRELWTALED